MTPNLHRRILIDAPSVVILPIERDSNAQQNGSSASHARSMVTLQDSVTKEARTSSFLSKLRNLRHTYYRQVHCMHKTVSFATNLKIPVQKILFCPQLKIQHTQAGIKNIPPPAHLITNLAYRLKPLHTRNLYLRSRLDTCKDMKIMHVSVYRLIVKDPELKN